MIIKMLESCGSRWNKKHRENKKGKKSLEDKLQLLREESRSYIKRLEEVTVKIAGGKRTLNNQWRFIVDMKTLNYNLVGNAESKTMQRPNTVVMSLIRSRPNHTEGEILSNLSLNQSQDQQKNVQSWGIHRKLGA